MNEEIKQILQKIYIDHDLQEADLDYAVAGKYAADLERLSQLNNSCYFIVDLYKFNYLFTSANFKGIFGYIPSKEYSDHLFLDSKIHPDDFSHYKKLQLRVGEFLLQQPKEERVNYKHIFELRVQNVQREYVRVSWERQALEVDKSGNLWLMLGILTIIPDQNAYSGFKSVFVHLKTGERIPFNSPPESASELSSREKEVLCYIQQGFLSKEIADKLAISINTVNIHRQNILRKMNVDNSFEAVNHARKLGWLD